MIKDTVEDFVRLLYMYLIWNEKRCKVPCLHYDIINIYMWIKCLNINICWYIYTLLLSSMNAEICNLTIKFNSSQIFPTVLGSAATLLYAFSLSTL